jgi:type II secretory pathway pseudopilin PulG
MICGTKRPISPEKGFSLIEVVFAVGIFLVTILALIGLLGPTLKSVDEVEKTDEVSSVVNTVNAFLQSSPDIAPSASKFNAIYNAVGDDGYATLFVYRWYDESNADAPIVKLEIGFGDTEGDNIDTAAVVNQGVTSRASFAAAAGPIYRVVLTVSSVTPEASRSSSRNSDKIYTLADPDVAAYPEGYFAMEVRIFAEDPPAPNQAFNAPAPTLKELANETPIFTYNTAIVR